MFALGGVSTSRTSPSLMRVPARVSSARPVALRAPARAPGALPVGTIAPARRAGVRPERRRVAVRPRASASDDAANKWELAASFARARRAQDECLDVVLGEMAALTREVAQLRREVDALKAQRGADGGGGGGGEAPAQAAAQAAPPPAAPSQAEKEARDMLDALVPTEPATESESRSESRSDASVPFPDDEDIADVPVRIDAAAWRGDGTDRSHLWPMCKTGEDDIYLMSTIQEAMNDAGYWAGEEDEADMYFGPSTQDALCYFQAGAGLPETGFVDADTWKALLGEERFRWGPVPGAIGFDEAAAEEPEPASSSTSSSSSSSMSSAALAAKEWSEGVTSLVNDDDAHASGNEDLWGDEEKNAPAASASSEWSGSTAKAADGTKWPVLRVEDGGMEVHKLQVLLDEQGYYSGEEDMEYWFFGTTTENALGTFQASNNLPDTGLTDVGTWRALLGEELAALGPDEALARVGDGDFPEDLSRQDRVFLIGEGRFEGSPRKD